jgi:hypothetical protein
LDEFFERHFGSATKKKQVHVRVDITAEDRASLGALLGTIMKWSEYHDLRDAAEAASSLMKFRFSLSGSLMKFSLPGFVANLHFFVA